MFDCVIHDIPHDQMSVRNNIYLIIKDFLEEDEDEEKPEDFFYFSGFYLQMHTPTRKPTTVEIRGFHEETSSTLKRPILRFSAKKGAEGVSADLLTECLEHLAYPIYRDLLDRIANGFPEKRKQIDRCSKSAYEKLILPTNSSDADDSVEHLKSLIPSTPKYRKKWIRGYELMTEMDKEYMRLWEEGYTDNPEPSPGEYIDMLITNMQYKCGNRTIKNIKIVGEAGLLKRDNQ